MIRILIAGAFALVFGGTVLVAFGGSEPVEARSAAITKGDRLDAKPFGSACSQVAWPYYEAGCLRNTVTATRDAKVIRIVTTDRLPQ